MGHVIERLAIGFYLYAIGLVVSLCIVNSWRKHRGYRTTIDRAHEED